MSLKTKTILIAVTSAILLILFLTQKQIFIFLLVTAISIAISVIIGFFSPLKLLGVELVTFSTIIAGSFFGSAFAAVFGVCLLVIHLIVSRYTGGPYLVWTIPSYIILGILSGFLTDVRLLIAMVVGVIVLDNVFTLTFYRENYMKTLIFSIGNITFNVLLLLNVYGFVTGLV
jgi:hypothetical protein